MNNSIQPKNVLGLFPIPIGCYAYQGDIVSLRDKVREYIKTRPYNQNNDNPNLKHYLQKGDNTDGSVNINDIFFNHFNTDLEQFFNDSAFHFHTQVLGLDIQSDYEVVDCWINECTAGSQPFHAHVNSFISGTFYLDHDDEAAPIEFVNPKLSHQIEPCITFTPNPNNSTVFSQPTGMVKPVPGDLLLWESHIRHGYNNNRSKNRLSISMNMIPRIVFSNRYGFEVKPIKEDWN